MRQASTSWLERKMADWTVERRIRGNSKDAICRKVHLGQGIQREDFPRDWNTQYSLTPQSQKGAEDQGSKDDSELLRVRGRQS
jgi:hypothetical protein